MLKSKQREQKEKGNYLWYVMLLLIQMFLYQRYLQEEQTLLQ